MPNTTEKKSTEYAIEVANKPSRKKMLQAVETAAGTAGLYISHIGGYSRVKYPNSIHWHFKRQPGEVGMIDATYWDEGLKFWLTVRKRNGAWVEGKVQPLVRALKQEFKRF